MAHAWIFIWLWVANAMVHLRKLSEANCAKLRCTWARGAWASAVLMWSMRSAVFIIACFVSYFPGFEGSVPFLDRIDYICSSHLAMGPDQMPKLGRELINRSLMSMGSVQECCRSAHSLDGSLFSHLVSPRSYWAPLTYCLAAESGLSALQLQRCRVWDCRAEHIIYLLKMLLLSVYMYKTIIRPYFQ